MGATDRSRNLIRLANGACGTGDHPALRGRVRPSALAMCVRYTLASARAAQRPAAPSERKLRYETEKREPVAPGVARFAQTAARALIDVTRRVAGRGACASGFGAACPAATRCAAGEELDMARARWVAQLRRGPPGRYLRRPNAPSRQRKPAARSVTAVCLFGLTESGLTLLAKAAFRAVHGGFDILQGPHLELPHVNVVLLLAHVAMRGV